MKPDYRHALRLFAVVAALLVAALLAKEWAIPASFGQHGRYRGAALELARAPEPRHLGQKACEKCHAGKVKLHDKDAHRNVQCETCHGPGQAHVASPATLLTRPKGKEPCLVCHQFLPARPGSFPQVDLKQHYQFVGVADPKTDCTECHDPHEPLFMDRDLRQARLHPTIHRCRDCHQGAERNETTPRPANHPPIFECNYCHGSIVKDFQARSHKNIRCATCHIYFKETEFAGRILRDADPRFCLLCHKGGEFRSKSAPPSIEWPEHRDDVASGPEDAQKRCIDCHQQNIHGVEHAPRRSAASPAGATESKDDNSDKKKGEGEADAGDKSKGN